MKTFFQFILAGFLGGCVVLVGMKLNGGFENIKPHEHFVKSVSMPVNFSPNSLPGDFVESAKRSTGSVVHIFAEESEQLISQRRNTRRQRDPFFDFFGLDDFFGGGNFYAPKNGTGSGVIFSNEGHIVTNNHVVGFADEITVTDANGKKYKAKKIGTDEASDLAVIQIENAKKLTPIKIGDSDKVQVGEWVLAVGNPFGYLTSTVTAGIVSAKGRSLNIIRRDDAVEEFIQTDAAINPGNSGGALVNLNGELIGINTAIATPTGAFAGYSFAIPAKIVRQVTKAIIEKGGDIDEAIGLGIGGYDVDFDLIQDKNLKLKEPKGFYIEDVERRSTAQLGGLLPGDVILEINNQTIGNYDDIKKTVRLVKQGEKMDIKINRDGKIVSIPVVLKKVF